MVFCNFIVKWLGFFHLYKKRLIDWIKSGGETEISGNLGSANYYLNAPGGLA
jgi:hypothetical protein